MDGVWCFIICFGASNPAPSVPLDTFCGSYERLVQTPADLAEIKKLPKDLRRRVQGNEADYLCRCKGWQDPICQKGKSK